MLDADRLAEGEELGSNILQLDRVLINTQAGRFASKPENTC
jgi:hypothetical protein